jgi:hypothetical protein
MNVQPAKAMQTIHYNCTYVRLAIEQSVSLARTKADYKAVRSENHGKRIKSVLEVHTQSERLNKKRLLSG